MSRLRNFSNEPGSYFFTTKTSAGRNLLQNAQWAGLLERILFEYRDAGEYLVHQYVIMPNHFHLLATTARAERPAKIMQLVKGRFSYELKKQYGVQRSPWQEGFASRRIRTFSQFRAAARYIELNPVKDHLCDSPQEYPFGSSKGKRRLDPMPEFGAKAQEERLAV
jgi:putative transposase